MSAQARGAIIGTTFAASALLATFLYFRWRKRHLQKHAPVPVLPRIRSSGDDLTNRAMSLLEFSSPMESSEGNSSMMFAPRPGPRLSPPRVLPSSKQALATHLQRHPSVGSEASSYPSEDTCQSSHGETSQHDTVSGYPEDEMPPVQGHSPATASPHEWYPWPTVPPLLRSPLSLQQLIGIELDNLLSSPDAQSPDNPLYTSISTSTRDHAGRFRVANETEHPANFGGGVASTSKRPQGPTEETDSQRRGHARLPELSSMEGRGGVPRRRVPISRYELECLADLVAARITREANQRTEPETSRAGPPPSYV